MPTISVNRDAFLEALGGQWSKHNCAFTTVAGPDGCTAFPNCVSVPTATKDAESLFFDYGLELDEDVGATHMLSIQLQALSDPSTTRQA